MEKTAMRQLAESIDFALRQYQNDLAGPLTDYERGQRDCLLSVKSDVLNMIPVEKEMIENVLIYKVQN